MEPYQNYLQSIGEYGTVTQARHPLIFADGIPGAALNEVVVFENGQQGYVTGLKESYAQIALLSHQLTPPGMKLARTGARMSINVGPAQLGNFITPLGEPLIPGTVIDGEVETRPIDIQPPHILERRPITDQLFTGVSVVDLLVPLAKGQREAIIGDQKTGKTSFLLAAAKAHAEQGGIVVYAAIGRPWSEIKKISDFIGGDMKTEQVVFVAASAEDVASLITVTPYSAATIAEYWRDQGKDVLLILHDLSTHARYYREVALLAQQFPGRESYPGDIFHAHARLLERGGSFGVKNSDKIASITCLAVGETVRSDVSSYIISNLISITDGHLLFDAVRFSEGQRPAVDVAGSVTRVGRKVQVSLAKQLYLDLIALLSKYEQAQQFSKFGTELSDKLLKTISTSKRLLELFAQPAFLTVPNEVQLVMVGVIWQGWLAELEEGATGMWRDRLVQHYQGSDEARELINQLMQSESVPKFFESLEQHREQITELCQSETL